MKLHTLAKDTAYRLDDEGNTVWSRAEIELYVRDGYEALARETKCIFDIHVCDNMPQTGNYSTDLERSLAEQRPGMGLTDTPGHFTAEHERNLTTKSLGGPTPATSPSEGGYFDDFEMPTLVPTGRLPDGVVDVLRVSWNQITLTAMGSQQLRQLDTQYETRQGDPRFWTWDKDGLMTIRLAPIPNGDASYNTVDGSRGTQKQTDETGITVVGTRGFLRERTGSFPAGGPRGTPRRRHPETNNIKVELARLGRDPQAHDFELPRSFLKYVVFWAMYQALKRQGPGQDSKLASHYKDRYELGKQRMTRRLDKISREYAGRIGFGAARGPAFGLGDPQPPYNYGKPHGSGVSGGY